MDEMSHVSDSLFGGVGFDLFAGASPEEISLLLAIVLAECFALVSMIIFPLWALVDYFRNRNKPGKLPWGARFRLFFRPYLLTVVTFIFMIIAAGLPRRIVLPNGSGECIFVAAMAAFPVWAIIDFIRTRYVPTQTTWCSRFMKFLRVCLFLSIGAIILLFCIDLHSRGFPPITLEAKFRRAVCNSTIVEKFPSSSINIGIVRTTEVVECRGWRIERAIEPNIIGEKNWRIRDPRGKVRWWGSKEELTKLF